MKQKNLKLMGVDYRDPLLATRPVPFWFALGMIDKKAVITYNSSCYVKFEMVSHSLVAS